MGTKDKYEPAYRAVVDGLIDRRKAKGMTQQDVALVIGTDQSQISKFERGERRLDIIDFLQLCRALGADPTELLGPAEKLLG